MPLNKHKIFYVLLSFLIDEVNHTAQPKIVVAAYTHNYNFRSGEISFSILIKILIEKLNGVYNLNVIHDIVRFMNNFQAIFQIETKRFLILCSHYALFWIRFVRLHIIFIQWKKKSKHLKSESECSHTFDQLLFLIFFFTH